MAAGQRKPRIQPEEVRLTKGGQTKVVRSRDDLVKAEFDGWIVDKAGEKSVANTPADNPAGDKAGDKPAPK